MTKFKPGRGLDVGTGFLVMTRMTEDGQVITKSVRDCFLEVKPANKLVLATMKKGLVKSGINFFEDGDTLIILGQDSLQQSIERQVVLQRPMSKGVISPTEAKALPMFKALLRELLGDPLVSNEKILFTVPAAPIDGTFDVVYHTAVIETILKDLGYDGKPINEAHAIAFSELENSDYTGITISMGSGMCNIGVVNVAELLVKFSISKGGDYVDQNTALSLGFDPNASFNHITPNLVTYIKEAGVDIINPDRADKIQLGIAAHYRSLVRYLVESLVMELSRNKSMPRFLNPVDLVIAGGTSLAKGVVDLFVEELTSVQDKLPFSVGKVRHSDHALDAVAQGCLIALLSEE